MEILAGTLITATMGLSFGDTVSATVGGVIVGAVIMPDTCRFIGPRNIAAVEYGMRVRPRTRAERGLPVLR